MDPSPLFDYMRERHSVYLRRQTGEAFPWTEDPILCQFRFCNVFRELDRTTIWMRENVREPIMRSGSAADLLLATVVFRWFNRIITGEAIFQQTMLDLGISPSFGTDSCTPWEMRKIQTVTTKEWLGWLRSSIVDVCGRNGPYVTGSYIIKTPDGMDKLTGVLWCIEQFMSQEHLVDAESLGPVGFQDMAECLHNSPGCFSLKDVWSWLRQFPYLGDFMAYEIVTDLRHTPLMSEAPDIHSWANPGPGAMRGLNRLAGRELARRLPRSAYIEEMQKLLFMSEDRELWPGEFPSLEMRDIEHSLCELDKYERVRLGEGQPRQRFRP